MTQCTVTNYWITINNTLTSNGLKQTVNRKIAYAFNKIVDTLHECLRIPWVRQCSAIQPTTNKRCNKSTRTLFCTSHHKLQHEICRLYHFYDKKEYYQQLGVTLGDLCTVELNARNLYEVMFQITEDHNHHLWRLHLSAIANTPDMMYEPIYYTHKECVNWTQKSSLNIDYPQNQHQICITLDNYYQQVDHTNFSTYQFNLFYFNQNYRRSYFTYTHSIDALDLAISNDKITFNTYEGRYEW